MTSANVGGGYAVSGIAELDSLIKKWRGVADAIRADGVRIVQLQVAALEMSPAEDGMSEQQASASASSIEKLVVRNQQAWEYARAYVDKLRAAREQYLRGEEHGVHGLRWVAGA